MKKINIYSCILALVVMFSACEKSAVQILTTPATGAQIKLFNFGLGAPSVNFYANSTKLTAVSIATGVESTAGIAYGSVGPANNYALVAAGTYDFKATISATIDKDLAIGLVNRTVEEGKAYSMYLSDVYNTTTKKVDAFIVEDGIPVLDESVTQIRFVNAIFNSVPMELYAKNTVTGVETKIGAAVSYKTGGAFTKIPDGVYDLSARAVGGTANLIARTGVSLIKGRFNSISARGDMTVVSTTLTNRPFLDNTVNR